MKIFYGISTKINEPDYLRRKRWMLKFKKQCLQKNIIHISSKENQNSQYKLVLSITATYNISVLIKGKRTNLD